MRLSDRDRAILDFERGWWAEPSPKADAIRSRFALSGARYYQLLSNLIDTEEAEAYDPLVVRRLRRGRSERRRARRGGAPAGPRRGTVGRGEAGAVRPRGVVPDGPPAPAGGQTVKAVVLILV